MEKCAKFLVENGEIKKILQEISCDSNGVIITRYPNWFIWGGGIVVFLFIWFLFVQPILNIWLARKSGLATLAEAENAEKVAMMKANARLNAAKANKEAEIIEAEAVSLSIEKIGNSLEQNPSYNKWQWIKMMDRDNDKSVIYVPTEANIPILEAGMRKNKNVVTEKDEEEV